MLIRADLGPATAARIAEAVGQGRYDREIDPEEVKRILAAEVAKVLAPAEVAFRFDDARKPFVILVVGVNGSGKTTTIGKLGAIASREGFSVALAACDTFRAAAIEQLAVWADRIGARLISRPAGADAAGLAFDALQAARAGRHRRPHRRHRGPAAEQGQPDGRAREDRPGAEEDRSRGSRTRPFWCSMPRPARTPSRRSRCSIAPRP